MVRSRLCHACRVGTEDMGTHKNPIGVLEFDESRDVAGRKRLWEACRACDGNGRQQFRKFIVAASKAKGKKEPQTSMP